MYTTHKITVMNIFYFHRSKPYILDPVDPYNNVIGEITRHYHRGPNVPKADIAVMQQVDRLQRDAKRTLNSFN